MAEVQTVTDEERLQKRIARKAYELFEQRGREDGHEMDDWLMAERVIKNEIEQGKGDPRTMERTVTRKNRSIHQ